MTTTMVTTPHRFVRFLASVTSEAEARAAAACGADIVDCKNPAEGALGALAHGVVTAIRRAVPAHIPVSATIGDLPADPDLMAAAARAMARTGCDIVKAGFFPGGDARPAIRRLGQDVPRSTRLVAVLMADASPDLGLVPDLAAAGFAGVMLDTAAKDGRTLLDHRTPAELRRFVMEARAAGLLAGLAGSLAVPQIAQLLTFEPDVLGFRGALCRGSAREQALEAVACAAVRAAIPQGPAHAGDHPRVLEAAS